MQKQLKELKTKQEAQNDRYYKKVAPIVANNHLYWSYDLRSSFDFLSYKMKDGTKYTNNVLSNRVILTGVFKPSDNLKATVRVEANNIYGMNSVPQYSPYNNISWVANETPDDTTIRIKEAFLIIILVMILCLVPEDALQQKASLQT